MKDSTTTNPEKEDVTIGHSYTTTHHFKPSTIQTIEFTKRHNYSIHYQRQRLAFAPMVAKTLGPRPSSVLLESCVSSRSTYVWLQH
jgi:hypothetical protein